MVDYINGSASVAEWLQQSSGILLKECANGFQQVAKQYKALQMDAMEDLVVTELEACLNRDFKAIQESLETYGRVQKSLLHYAAFLRDGMEDSYSDGVMPPFKTETAVTGSWKRGKKEKLWDKALTDMCKVKDPYTRPTTTWPKDKTDRIWNDAKDAHGRVHDPGTGRYMAKNQPWHRGHRPGYEFRKHQLSAMQRGISWEQFRSEYYNEKHYRPELPISNMNHRGENKTDEYFGD